VITDGRRRFHEGPLRVLVGKERFSENHAWSEMPRYWPAGLADHVVIEVTGQGQLEARLADGGPPVDVIVPLFSALPGRAISAGSFGLIQQFGVGVDNIDLDAAADAGVWIANMPGLNAGAVGTQIARRLAAFDVTVTGLRRHSSDGPVPPFAAIYGTDRLLDCVADVDSVIISATYQPGQPPLVDDTVLRAMRPGAWLVNIARGGLLDADAASAHLNTGHLAGIGLDVFPTEPYPADGPLVTNLRIVATAHTAALTSDYFAAASRRLGDALVSYLDHQPPTGLLS
jgi:phosphoglycerate dehydrogenase-like enzyme